MKNKIVFILALFTFTFSPLVNFLGSNNASAASSNASKICEAIYKNSRNQSKNTLVSDCETAFDESKKTNNSYNSLCGGQNINIDADACKLGWYASILKLSVSEASDAGNYVDACRSYGTNQALVNACKTGVAASLKNEPNDNACNKYKDVTRSNPKTVCKKAFAASDAYVSQQAANSDSPSTQDSGNNNSQIGCDTQLTNPLTWIICPVTSVLVDLVNKLDGVITSMLSIESDKQIFCDTGSCVGYYKAWQSFRNIALGILVLTGLVIVMSQALGLEILDAYTIRKSLPRVLIAAIGITLSWPLMHFLVTLFNDLGYGIRALIYAPFNSLPNSNIDLSFGGGAGDFFFGGLTAAGGAVAAVPIWIIFGGAATMLAWASTAALAVFIAIVVLVLRQIVIILMILVAPIAIVCYVLPNTQKYFKFWWESFSKAMLMFPLIAGFIAVGRVFSAISFSAGGFLFQIIGFISYFAPYFMIPLTFKFAGNILGSLGGMVNSRSQMGFKGLAGFRRKQYASRTQRARSGGLYRDTKLGRQLNKIGDYTIDADEKLAHTIGKKGGRVGNALFGSRAAELEEQIAHAKAQHSAKAAQDLNMHYTTAWAAAGDIDRFKKDLSASDFAQLEKFRGTGPKSFKEAEEMSAILGRGSAGSNAALASTGLEAASGVMSRMKLNPETQRATFQSVGMLAAAAAGKVDPEQAANYYNQLKASGSSEAEATTMLNQVLQAAEPQRQDMRLGRAIRIGQNGKAYSVFSSGDETGSGAPAYQSKETLDLLQTNVGSKIAAGKAGDYYRGTAEAYKYHIEHAEPAMAEKLKEQLLQQSNAWSQADPEAKVEVDKILDSVGVDEAARAAYHSRGAPESAKAGGAPPSPGGNPVAGAPPGAPPAMPSGGSPLPGGPGPA